MLGFSVRERENVSILTQFNAVKTNIASYGVQIDAVQFMLKAWNSLNDSERADLSKYRLFVHTTFTVWPWHKDAKIAHGSWHTIKKELSRVPNVVIHLAHVSTADIIKVLKKIFDLAPVGKIWLENPAHTGVYNTAKGTVALAKALVDAHLTDRVGLCLDTAHLWSAGTNIKTYHSMWRYLQQIRGVDLMFHLNDQKYTFGSQQDQHETLGAGTIWDLDSPIKIVDSSVMAIWDWCFLYSCDFIYERSSVLPIKDIELFATHWMPDEKQPTIEM